MRIVIIFNILLMPPPNYNMNTFLNAACISRLCVMFVSVFVCVSVCMYACLHLWVREFVHLCPLLSCVVTNARIK